MDKITFEEIAIRMTELNDPREGELNIAQARAALRCALVALAERNPYTAMEFTASELGKYRVGVIEKLLGEVPERRRPGK